MSEEAGVRRYGAGHVMPGRPFNLLRSEVLEGSAHQTWRELAQIVLKPWSIEEGNMANKHLLWLIGFVLILISNAAIAFVPELAKEQRHTAYFGIITKNLEGEEEFEVADTVPLIEG